MPRTAKSTKQENAAKPNGNPIPDLTRAGFEALAEAGKITVETAAQQGALAMDAAKEGLRFTAMAGAGTVLGLAARGVSTYVAAQKAALELGVKQSAIIAEAVKPASDQVVPGAADAVQRGVEQAAAAQTFLLDYAAMQNGSVVGSLRRAVDAAGSDSREKLTGAVRQSVLGLLDTEKKVIDLIGRTAKSAKAGL